MQCSLCGYTQKLTSYQEASIALTSHLDYRHEGWDEEPAKEYNSLREIPGLDSGDFEDG